MQRIIRIDSQGHTQRGSQGTVELEILRGAARHRRRKVTVPVFLIGTANDCDLVLGDPAMPEVHTYLYVRAEGVTIRTLGAAPPLQVEGRPVESARLRDGNSFAIGPFAFRVHISPGTRPPAEDDDRAACCRPSHADEDREAGAADRYGADGPAAAAVESVANGRHGAAFSLAAASTRQLVRASA
jgi:predicted component of type VI protein secretion system